MPATATYNDEVVNARVRVVLKDNSHRHEKKSSERAPIQEGALDLLLGQQAARPGGRDP